VGTAAGLEGAEAMTTFDEWFAKHAPPLFHAMYHEGLKQAFEAGQRTTDLTEQERTVVIALAEIGEHESPWAWESDWPDGVTGEDVKRIIDKLNGLWHG
jgi:hypothetical protein